jgi:hypothetical protein
VTAKSSEATAVGHADIANIDSVASASIAAGLIQTISGSIQQRVLGSIGENTSGEPANRGGGGGG